MKLHDVELARLMLDQARQLTDTIQGRRPIDLEADPDFVAVVAWRLLELVNRAGDVSTEVQGQHPELPWREFLGLRKMLLHGQQALDLSIIWNVVAADLPRLLPRLKALADGLPTPGDRRSLRPTAAGKGQSDCQLTAAPRPPPRWRPGHRDRRGRPGCA